MIYFIPTAIVLFVQLYLLISWWHSRRKKDGRDKMLCLWGFLVGQLYLIWEVLLVKAIGIPIPDSPEQGMLMLRLACGASWGGLFTIIGLFYLSFATHLPQSPPSSNDDEPNS